MLLSKKPYNAIIFIFIIGIFLTSCSSYNRTVTLDDLNPDEYKDSPMLEKIALELKKKDKDFICFEYLPFEEYPESILSDPRLFDLLELTLNTKSSINEYEISRLRAMYLLIKLKDKRKAKLANKILNDENENSKIRILAGDILVGLGDMKAQKPIIDILLNFTNKNISAQTYSTACAALLKLKKEYGIESLNQQTIEFFMKKLNANSMDVRDLTCHFLGEVGNKKLKEPLIKILNDKNSKGKKEACLLLRRYGDEQAVASLINLLKDKKQDIRKYACLVLGDIGDKKAIQPIQALLISKNNNRDVKSVARFALRKIEKRMVETEAKPEPTEQK